MGSKSHGLELALTAANPALIHRLSQLALEHFVHDGSIDSAALQEVANLGGLDPAAAHALTNQLIESGIRIEELPPPLPASNDHAEVPAATKGQGVAPPASESIKAVLWRFLSLDDAEHFLNGLTNEEMRLLSEDEEFKLGSLIQSTGVGERKMMTELEGDANRATALGIAARDELERRNMRLVSWFANQRVGLGLDFAELQQEGWFGLRRAAEKFNPDLGYRFSTYAIQWIRQSIDRGIANQARMIRLPVHVVTAINKMVRIQRQLLAKSGNAPTQLIAQLAGIDKEEVEQLLALNRGVTSLDAPHRSGDGHLGDSLVDNDATFRSETDIERQELRYLVASALKELDEREARVLKLRFGLDGNEPMTLEEVGAAIGGLTRERARQIQLEALDKVGRWMRLRVEDW